MRIGRLYRSSEVYLVKVSESSGEGQGRLLSWIIVRHGQVKRANSGKGGQLRGGGRIGLYVTLRRSDGHGSGQLGKQLITVTQAIRMSTVAARFA